MREKALISRPHFKYLYFLLGKGKIFDWEEFLELGKGFLPSNPSDTLE
jgi:hypothetical protein